MRHHRQSAAFSSTHSGLIAILLIALFAMYSLSAWTWQKERELWTKLHVHSIDDPHVRAAMQKEMFQGRLEPNPVTARYARQQTSYSWSSFKQKPLSYQVQGPCLTCAYAAVTNYFRFYGVKIDMTDVQKLACGETCPSAGATTLKTHLLVGVGRAFKAEVPAQGFSGSVIITEQKKHSSRKLRHSDFPVIATVNGRTCRMKHEDKKWVDLKSGVNSHSVVVTGRLGPNKYSIINSWGRYRTHGVMENCQFSSDPVSIKFKLTDVPGVQKLAPFNTDCGKFWDSSYSEDSFL